MKNFAMVLGVGAFTLAQSTFAANVRAYPQWSSDQVRAARSGSPAAALLFDLQSTVQMEGKPDKVVHETVELAPSFIFVDAPDQQVLDDGDLCRTLIWARAKTTFHSESCYAAPAFRSFELVNRENLQRMMATAKLKGAPFDDPPYWREAELGVQRTPTDPLTRAKTGDGVDYALGTETVVRISNSTSQFQSDEARRFVRFMALHTQLHPEVRRDLLGASSLPTILEITGQVSAKKRHETLIISNVRRLRVDYPLPPGLTSDLQAQTFSPTR